MLKLEVRMLYPDAIIIGTGRAGVGAAIGGCRLEGRDHQTQAFRRHVREHRLHPDENAGSESAYAAHVTRRAADYGVTISGAVSVDMKLVKARKDAVVAQSRNGLERLLKTLKGRPVYEGHGQFVAETKMPVNGSELGADRIFINVGTRAAIPPIPGLDRVRVVVNRTATSAALRAR
jgi:hypothetical protein